MTIFEIIFADLEQCASCKLIEVEMERNNCIRVMLSDPERDESIRLYSLYFRLLLP